MPTCPPTDGTMPATNIPRGGMRSVSDPIIGVAMSTMAMNAVIGSPIATLAAQAGDRLVDLIEVQRQERTRDLLRQHEQEERNPHVHRRAGNERVLRAGQREVEARPDAVEHIPDALLDAAVELHLVRVLGLLHKVRERGVDAVQRGVDEVSEAAHLVPVAHAEAAAEVAPGAELQQAIHQANRPRDPDHHQGHQQLDPDQQGDQQHGADVQAQRRQLGAHRPLPAPAPAGNATCVPSSRLIGSSTNSPPAASRVDSAAMPRA